MPIGTRNTALLFDVKHLPVTRLPREEKQKSNDLFGLIFGAIITTILGIILAPIGGAALGALGTSLALSTTTTEVLTVIGEVGTDFLINELYNVINNDVSASNSLLNLLLPLGESKVAKAIKKNGLWKGLSKTTIKKRQLWSKIITEGKLSYDLTKMIKDYLNQHAKQNNPIPYHFTNPINLQKNINQKLGYQTKQLSQLDYFNYQQITLIKRKAANLITNQQWKQAPNNFKIRMDDINYVNNILNPLNKSWSQIISLDFASWLTIINELIQNNVKPQDIANISLLRTRYLTQEKLTLGLTSKFNFSKRLLNNSVEIKNLFTELNNETEKLSLIIDQLGWELKTDQTKLLTLINSFLNKNNNDLTLVNQKVHSLVKPIKFKKILNLQKTTETNLSSLKYFNNFPLFSKFLIYQLIMLIRLQNLTN
ncbi:hypothetical protein [Spiroplasma sp. DGKH1]|uniref:hypothetical protein n=1 Tax=Spiroplasma sp. DGKH1 TaxID=3050074 RepID=UPI0034C5FD61